MERFEMNAPNQIKAQNLTFNPKGSIESYGSWIIYKFTAQAISKTCQTEKEMSFELRAMLGAECISQGDDTLCRADFLCYAVHH